MDRNFDGSAEQAEFQFVYGKAVCVEVDPSIDFNTTSLLGFFLRASIGTGTGIAAGSDI